MSFPNRYQLLITIISLCLGISNGVAQDTLHLSLQEARRLAFENNTNIRNSALDMEIARKKIWETTAIGLPHIDSKAAYQFLPNVPTLPPGTMGPGTPAVELGVKNNVTFDVTASQLIFNGSYLVGLKAMKTLYQQTNESTEKIVQDVNESVINTYYMILVAEESLKNLQKNLDNVKKTEYEITEMNKQGFVEKTDVDQLELTANNLKNAMNQVKGNLDVANKLFKIIVGLDVNKNIALTESLGSSQALPVTINALVNEPFNIDKNIDYRIIKTATALSKLEYQNAIAAYMPVISGFYNHTEKANKPAFDFTVKDVLGINVSLPIFSSGQRMAAVSQKKLAISKMDNTRQLIYNNLLMQADQYQTELKLKFEKYDIQKKSLALSDEIYQRTLEKYKNGVSSSMELTTTQNQYLTGLSSYYQSIYDLVTAKTKLEKLYNINQEINKQ
ncbi:MAG: TolC family protein [Prolixibacteraceae bacterium]|jgi:outer membrane protein TolC|nr:TolC family protein [Prolixibacteraceae bacterium]